MHALTTEEQTLADSAQEYVKKHKKVLILKYANPEQIPPDTAPISIFMAGSPGAGKTEYSKELVGLIERNDHRQVVRIDPDVIRESLPGYTGDNAYIFQKAATIATHEIHTATLKRAQNFILDGTLSKYENAVQNIERSLSRSRNVYIFYIYQDPLIAWKFTQAREKTEGRRIEKHTFISQFFSSRDTANRLKRKFGSKIQIMLVQKDFDQNIFDFKSNVDNIDSHIKSKYTKIELEEKIEE